MNKYQIALDELEFTSVQYYGDKENHIAVEDMIENSKVLQELIDMHNKPLKFEEIKEGMWLWDSMCEEYIQVIDDEWHEYYEENRFYRYQPLEEGDSDE